MESHCYDEDAYREWQREGIEMYGSSDPAANEQRCQGSDDCTFRFPDLPAVVTKCDCCELPVCPAHSIRVNGVLMCEVSLKAKRIAL